uniref:Uncharacterized protein n=1 Tax=Glossina brevipalpis TaxID=37001 RepID=A0A1A9WQT9_9MUSC
MCHEVPLKFFCLLVAIVSIIENSFNFFLLDFTTKRGYQNKSCHYYNNETFHYVVHDEYFQVLTYSNPERTDITNNDFFFLPSKIVPRGWQDFAITANSIAMICNVGLLISSPLSRLVPYICRFQDFPNKKMALIAWELIYFLYFCFVISVLFACGLNPLNCKGCIETMHEYARGIIWDISILIDAIFHTSKHLDIKLDHNQLFVVLLVVVCYNDDCVLSIAHSKLWQYTQIKLTQAFRCLISFSSPSTTHQHEFGIGTINLANFLMDHMIFLKKEILKINLFMVFCRFLSLLVIITLQLILYGGGFVSGKSQFSYGNRNANAI